MLNEQVKMGIMCQGSIIYPYREMEEVYVVLTHRLPDSQDRPSCASRAHPENENQVEASLF